MKFLSVLFIVCLSLSIQAQPPATPKGQVRLIFPDHVKEAIKSKGDLYIHLYYSARDTQKILYSKVIAQKVGENTYEFDLSERLYVVIGFQFGKYSNALYCLYNAKGDDRKFEINLEKTDVDYANLKFFPPCPQSDKETTE